MMTSRTTTFHVVIYWLRFVIAYTTKMGSGCARIDIHFSPRNYGGPLFSEPPLNRDAVWTKQRKCQEDA